MRLSIRRKLFLGFGAVVALGLAVGIVAVISMGSMNSDATAVTDNDLPTIQLVGDIAAAAGHYRSDQFEAVSAEMVGVDRYGMDILATLEGDENRRAVRVNFTEQTDDTDAVRQQTIALLREARAQLAAG